ncbi:hypothetical protein Tco_0260900 [Tanacetum coccineum]
MPRILIPLRPILGVLQIGIKSQDTIMSDSEHSTVTYTSLSEDDLYMGSPGVEINDSHRQITKFLRFIELNFPVSITPSVKDQGVFLFQGAIALCSSSIGRWHAFPYTSL